MFQIRRASVTTTGCRLKSPLTRAFGRRSASADWSFGVSEG
ncbi:MAG: hypothetical protein N3B68_00710 [Anaerolineae bacterium]|nr:hypothetical protein [Anaerolineae bacterium]